MADLQQSVLGDMETKQHIVNQIVQWEENLERLHCEQFRLRCYMASLQVGELPNPKVSSSFRKLLLQITKVTVLVSNRPTLREDKKISKFYLN